MPWGTCHRAAVSKANRQLLIDGLCKTVDIAPVRPEHTVSSCSRNLKLLAGSEGSSLHHLKRGTAPTISFIELGGLFNVHPTSEEGRIRVRVCP